MPRKGKKARPLNARQREFVRHFTAGNDGVRGNQTRAYVAAGYSPKGAHKLAARLMANDGVQNAVAEAHRKAEEAAAERLRDWKELAPAAQQRLVDIAEGKVPGGIAQPPRRRGQSMADYLAELAAAEAAGAEKPPARIADRDDAAAAKVILDANMEILERAEPKKLRVMVEDPASELARLLGVKPEAVPGKER